MKKVLAICGSPRKGGNTEHAMNAVRKGFEGKAQVETLNLGEIKVAPCIACYRCAQERACVIDDDMESIYKKLDEADIIIAASPLCFTSVSAQLKALIDRCQAIYVSKYERGKPIIDVHKKRAGGFLCTAGSTHPDFTGALMVVDLFFKAVNAKHIADLLLDDTDKLPVKSRSDLESSCAQLAQALLCAVES